MRRLTHSSAIICAVILTATLSVLAEQAEPRKCTTNLGGQVVCGDLVIGITLEQYEAGLKRRADEIRAEEAEKRIQLQKLLELTERAASAEKDDLQSQIASVETEKRALAIESKAISERLTNLQASYDGLVQKLAEANAALQAFAPLISKEAFEQAQAMLSGGDVLGAERKFVEIANALAKIREQADAVEARVIFQAAILAEQRIDWRAAYAHYSRAAKLEPSNRLYVWKAGRLADEMGDYATAASFEEAVLTLTTYEFGSDTWQTAAVLNDLANTYANLARYPDAEPLFRRAIEIGEKTLGKEHPDVAARYNNLATLFESQGKYADAEPLFRRAIEIDEKALGKEHPDVGLEYNNLAALLQDEGQYADAEPLFRRAIEIGEKTLGKEHPDVATRYNNLAIVLYNQRKYTEAEPLFRRAIEIDEKTLGKEHPAVASEYNNLAELLQGERKYAEAEPLFRQAVEIDEKTLGKEHPALAIRYNNLARLLQDEGKYADAEPLFRRAIEIGEKALGREHPNVAVWYQNLAFVLAQQRKHAEAEPLLRRAIEILQTTFGPSHPDTLKGKENYNRLQELKKKSGSPAADNDR
jgi:tetratricopeptide (TPR) repeat protein